MIALAGLEEAADQRARTLSGGQQRRLDLALALVGDPELSSSTSRPPASTPPRGAPRGTSIRSLRDLGKTVLLTTHYLDEAQALADRVAIVKDGAILAEGPPATLAPAPRATASPSAPPTARASERETDDPTALLHELTAAALARGERLEELSVTRPSLEDVYLELTETERPRARGRAAASERAAPGVGRRSPGASTGSSAGCSGATRARRSSTSCCRCCSSALFGALFAGDQDGPRRDRARASPA